MDGSIKLKISKPGMKLNVNFTRVDKQTSAVLKRINDLLLFNSCPGDEFESLPMLDMQFCEYESLQEIAKTKDGRGFIEKYKATSKDMKYFRLNIKIQKEIDVAAGQNLVQVDKDCLNREVKAAFFDFKPTEVNGIVLYLIGKTLPQQQITLIKETFEKRFNYAETKLVPSNKDYGDSIALDVFIYGSFPEEPLI